MDGEELRCTPGDKENSPRDFCRGSLSPALPLRRVAVAGGRVLRLACGPARTGCGADGSKRTLSLSGPAGEPLT